MYNNLKRIYLDIQLEEQKTFLVDQKDIINRLKNVLRLRVGDKIKIFHQNAGEYLAIITLINQKQIEIKIDQKIKNAELSKELQVIIPIIKPDRFRWMIEKCTELGVANIIIYKPNRGQFEKINLEKINQYVIGACEQSERITIPNIELIQDLTKFLSTNKSKILFCNEYESKISIINALDAEKNINTVLVGPEGGFTDEEITKLRNKANVVSVYLSDKILRTETAVIFGLSALLICNNIIINPAK